MKRKIVNIQEDKCNGCGLCVEACHEGALQKVNGKAKLVSDTYCDGLGDCLPECPAGAITIEEREAGDYDEEAVKIRMQEKKTGNTRKNTEPPTLPCGCPGTHSKVINRSNNGQLHASHDKAADAGHTTPCHTPAGHTPAVSRLGQWPCQIKLVPVNAPYFDNANLLVAADCTAYAYAGIHNDFMANKVTIIGCPKLDNVSYTEKLSEILKTHEIKSVTVLRMEVPCCGGISNAVKDALIASGKMIPWRIVTIGVDGNIIED